VRWFLLDDLRSFGHRSRMNKIGYSATDYVWRPVKRSSILPHGARSKEGSFDDVCQDIA